MNIPFPKSIYASYKAGRSRIFWDTLKLVKFKIISLKSFSGVCGIVLASVSEEKAGTAKNQLECFMCKCVVSL